MTRQGSLRSGIAKAAAVGATALVAALAPAAAADPPPPGSDWSQASIHEADGTDLHVDVLRPHGLRNADKTPVILSIGPYFNHSGQTGPAGPVEDTPFDPVTSTGPSSRFYDFVNGAHLMQRGYAYVMVDLRGFGGSTGCLDWAGPGEQADVKAAVEWAASQPWSTGKVGMYGKSYDAVTGLIGEVEHPRGLSAVVAQEPVYDMYRYLYSNGVRYENSLATPALYDAIAATPGSATGDTLAYNTNSVNDTARPGCPALNEADQQDSNHSSGYWQTRNFIPRARGATTPLFMTQGFAENNTKPDGTWDFFNNVAGPKRAWFGMWDHVRGNDTDPKTGRLAMGRAGWFDEVMRFYDQYLKGIKPAVKDPTLAVESSDGKWRAEQQWPPADSYSLTANLNPGSYNDNAQNNGEDADGSAPNGLGVWTFSPPLSSQAHFAGVPRFTADVSTTLPNANLVADVYDVDAAGNATLISRGAYLVPSSGKYSFDLYGDDWILPAGHRLGVLVTSSNAEWWQAAMPTGQNVTVNSASVSLPFLTCARTQTIEGGESLRLADYLAHAPFAVDSATISGATKNGFPLPAAAASCSTAERAGAPAARCADTRKFAFHVHQPVHGRIVRVEAFVNGKRRARVHGRRIKRFTLRRLPQGVFTVRIVATAANGQQTISVRRYHGCRKTRPHTHVRHRHRH